MITKREKELSNIMIVVQIVLTLLLFLVTGLFFPQHKHHINNTIALLTQIAIVWSVFLHKLKLGTIFRAQSIASMLRGYMVTVFFGCFFLFQEVLIISHFRHIAYSLEFIELFGVINLLGLISFKLLFHRIMLILRKNGFNSRNIVIIADSTSVLFIDSFIKAKDWGYHLVSIITTDKDLKKHFKKTHLVTGFEMLKSYIHCNPIDDIFYCLPIDDNQFNVEQLINEMDQIGVTLHIMQQATVNKKYSFIKENFILNRSFITHKTVTDKYFELKIKEFFDIIFSVIILFTISPLLALIAILIKKEDGGPVFFKQERIGLNGRRFRCYKFRTMVVNAEELLGHLADRNEADGPTFKIVNDPRITKIGRFLRKTSLDELPQFYNVLKGEMSVVGPRPPLLREVKQYEQVQLRRLSMKPGITCTWQVWGRHKVSFVEWMQMDLDYIDKWSIILDIKIILATIAVVFKADGQ
jgi:exopolysaccharide biosynthesis polyprenyl glycosylphosphotransferase